jgi:hypothetical protein
MFIEASYVQVIAWSRAARTRRGLGIILLTINAGKSSTVPMHGKADAWPLVLGRSYRRM